MLPAGSETPCMHGNSLRGMREIPCLALERLHRGPHGKPKRGTAMKYGEGKSDSPIVPGKCSNKTGTGPAGDVSYETETSKAAGADRDQKPEAESMEGRGLAKGNSDGQSRDRTQRRASLKQALDRVRQAARRYKDGQMTALWHHVCDVERLCKAYGELKPKAAAGVDGVTWHRYGKALEGNLQDLSDRLRRGAYRAKPVGRAYVPKGDGSQRPIGIPTLEDKIVQRATVEVLNAVYEQDFLGFSYGFRPGRNQHQALDAVWVGIVVKKVSWVLDGDIRGFFDAIDHDWMIRMLEHRIGDKRVVRHVMKWLKTGVMEDGNLHQMSMTAIPGRPGSVARPDAFLRRTLPLVTTYCQLTCDWFVPPTVPVNVYDLSPILTSDS